MRRGLSHLRVIDFSSGIPGAYCCRLLADAGADVIKVESREGDPWRSWCAGSDTIDPVEGAALFRFLHHGMRSVIGRAHDPAVQELIGTADIVVEGFRPSVIDPLEIVARHPGLVVLSITPYGRTGPYADRPTTEFVVQAESGGLVGRGSPHDAPFQAGGRTSEWVAATFAAVAVTAAALRAQWTGYGEHIDFSVTEAMNIAASGYAALNRQLRGHPPIVDVQRWLETPSVEPTLDGYVGFCTNSRDQFNNFLILIERFDLLEHDEFALATARQERWKEWNDAVHAWTTCRTTADIVKNASELRIPVAPVHDDEMVLSCDHFVARRVFVEDATGTFKMPRRPWRMDGQDPPPPRPSPRLGEHTGEVEPRTPTRPPAPIGQCLLPLAGIRVLDLTAWWAGPVAAGTLAALGADVIHVESTARPDGMRMTGGTLGLEGEWWERSPHFLASNTNKRDLTLDLTTADGLTLLKRLIAKSDVFIENFSPRVLANFGLDWESIHALNPRCLLVRMPAFGLSGPWRDNTGFAQTMEQVTGLAWLTGHRHDQPRIQSGPSDPNAGMHAAFAMLVGLAERDVTGIGCHLEVTMVEGALNAAAELIIERTAYGNRLQRDGNRSPNVAPQGLYACSGFDQWLAISVATDDQWESLVRAIGGPDWAPAVELATYEGRRARHDEIDTWLSSWCESQQSAEACELLVDHGVPAGVGWDPRAMVEHPQLRHRNFYEDVDHPLLGRLTLPSLPFRFASTPHWLRSAAPTLGQHNCEILQVELGIGTEQYGQLEEQGVIGQRPQGL